MNYLTPITIVIVAGFVLSGMDAVAKHLMRELLPLQVIWARYFFHTIIVAMVFRIQSDWRFIKPKRPGLQALRAICLMGVTLCMYFAISIIPLADATAIMFFAPVLVTVLAGWLLGDKITGRHLTAVVVGFCGVLFIVQPGFNTVDTSMLLACMAALFLAFYFILTRFLSGLDEERTTLFHSTALGSILLSVFLPFVWVTPSACQWMLLIATGVLGATGHFMLIRAFHSAPAPVLSPFLNFQLVAATLYSVIFFGDSLSTSFLVGAGLVVSAGFIVWVKDWLAALRRHS